MLKQLIAGRRTVGPSSSIINDMSFLPRFDISMAGKDWIK
jgi:hypothetical protein